MSGTVVIYPNVDIGEGTTIGEFCIIGEPPTGSAVGELKTVIGPGSVIRSHTVIYAGNVIGARLSTGHHVCIRESNRIGEGVSIGTLSCIEHHVSIGDGVRIHSQAFIPEYTTLEAEAWVGPKVAFTNARYPRSKDAKAHLAGPIVRRSAKIGANSTILPGVVIGRGSLVGAGSVVVDDVQEGKIVVGNPARVIGETGDIEGYRE